MQQQTDAKSLARTGTEAESAVPAMHHPNWSGPPGGLGTPSHNGGNSSLDSGLHLVQYGQPGGAVATPSSQSSAPHGPYHGAPYGVPAGGNYGGPNYVGSYAGSQYGSPAPHDGSQPAASQVGGYGGAAYGAASYAGSEYRQEAARPRGYGMHADGASGSDAGMHAAPPMHGSINNTSVMGSTQPGDGYAGVPQPVAVGSGNGMPAPNGSAGEESDSMLGGPPMLPPAGGSQPRLDADGRVVSPPPPVPDAAAGGTPPQAAAPPAPYVHAAPAAPEAVKLGVPHTAKLEGAALPQPERGPDLLALGNTQEAAKGPFSAAAARGGGVYAPDASAGEPPAVREPRPQHDRLATQVFDKTVAPDMDIADFTHEKVVDMLEDVHSEKALFRDKYAAYPVPPMRFCPRPARPRPSTCPPACICYACFPHVRAPPFPSSVIQC